MPRRTKAANDVAVRKTSSKPINIRSSTDGDAYIGQRLRMRRMEQHLSQAELGQHLGVTFQQIQKYEKGVNRIGADRLQKICEVLSTPMSFFFDGDGTGKSMAPTKLTTFMATKDGVEIVEAAMVLTPAKRRIVIALARSLINI